MRAGADRGRWARIAILTATTLAASGVFALMALAGFGIGYALFLNDRHLTAGLALIGGVAGVSGGAIAAGGILFALRCPRRPLGAWALLVASVWTIGGAGGFAARPGAWWIVALALGAMTYAGALAGALLGNAPR